MPVYKGRKKGTHRVVVWVNGKANEEIFEGPKADAWEHESRMRIDLRASRGDRSRIAPLFSDFATEQYSPFARQHLASSTWKRERRYTVVTLAEFFGEYRLTELSDELVDEYKEFRTRARCGPGKINSEIKALRTMLRFAEDDRHLPVAKLRLRRLPENLSGRVLAWTAEEVARIYDAAVTDSEMLAMLIFLLNTGCRKGESIAFEWSWVDSRRQMLCVPVTRWWRPKSKRPREVPMSAAVLSMLAERQRSVRHVFQKQRHGGGPYRQFPDERLKEVLKAAGVAGSAHTTRHTFASHFLRAVPDLEQLAKLLGHSSVATTRLYAHLLPGYLESARGAVDLAPRGAPGRLQIVK